MRCGLFLLLLLGCAEPPAARSAPLVQASIALGADEVLLDARGPELLVGRVEAAPEGSDADRVLVARGAGIDGRRVLDARFVGALLVVLDADHRLRVLDRERETLLDEHAEAPLSVAAGAIAYVRGEMPDFEVVRAEPSSGVVTAVAPDVRPAWSPALSPDGREVVFVTSATGTPRLYRTGRGFVDAPRFATMPSAPLWRGAQLVVWDERGVAWLDLEGGQLVREDVELTGLLATADGRVLARRGAAYEALR